MKTTLAIIGLTLSVCFWWRIDVWAQERNIKKETPKYSVTLTVEEWNAVLNGIEATKNYLKASTSPAKDVTYLGDSILTPIQQRFAAQINLQIQQQSDTTKSKSNGKQGK